MILRRDHIAGGAFVAGGALVLALSGDLPCGTLASPGACMLPKHVALNVPEPVVPVNDVTAQLKFVHDSARFAPACATVTQVPPSIDDVLLGVVTVLLDLKQPALSRAAETTRARIRFMFESLSDFALRDYL